MRPEVSRAFRRGAAAGLPFILVLGPFALLFGVVATEAGLPVLETFVMSVLVLAGAGQFTAVQLLAEQTPVLILLAAALTVNLRMAMYSASIAPYLRGASHWQRALAAYCLVDQNYALGLLEYEKRPEQGIAERLGFYFGVVVPIMPVWHGFTLVGALVGARIPDAFALDFALPITFLAMVAPALRTFPHVVAALVSVGAALLLAFLPYQIGLLGAALLAMCAGAATEQALRRRRRKGVAWS